MRGVNSGAFKGNTKITSVTFPESSYFKYINASAFEGCTGLTSITIPSGIGKITGENDKGLHKDAFKGCDNLVSVTINNNAIASNSYSSTSQNIADVFPKLLFLTFGNNVTKIGSYVCHKNAKDCQLKTLDCGKATSIDIYAFDYCKELYSVDLGSVTSVGTGCFEGCTNLKKMDLKNLLTDENVEHEGLETLRVSTTNTTKITSENVKNIIFSSVFSTVPNHFFDDKLYKIETVTFENEDGIVIPHNAFGGVYKRFPELATVNGKILKVGSEAFYIHSEVSLGKLTTIDLSNATVIEDHAFERQGLKQIDLANVEEIEDYAFRGCSNLSTISKDRYWTSSISYVPALSFSKLKSIGTSAFEGTIVSGYLTLRDCESIGESAFKKTRLLKVQLYSCGYVGKEAFANCGAIKDLVVSGEVEESAFSNCTGLESVTINSESIANPSKGYELGDNISRYFGTNVNKFVFNTTTVGVNILVAYPEVTTLEFTSNVNSVGDVAAAMCPKLTTVTFSKTLGSVNVGASAFALCPNLTTVSGKFGTLDTGAFGYCSSLNDVDFKNSIVDILNEAFIGDVALQTIKNVLVEKIGDRAFKDCSTFTGEGMKFASDITTIGESAFENCSSLKTMPNFPAVENVGNKAFKGCRSMYVYMDNLPKVKNIGAQAFMNCAHLSNNSGLYGSGTTIPNTIESIGDEAFKGMSPYSLQLSGDNLKSLGKDVFVHVPDLTINCPSYLAQNFTTDNNILSSVKFLPESVSLIIGNDVTAIGNNAFNNTSDPIEFKYYITLNTRKLTTLGTDCFKGLKSGGFYIYPSSAEISSNAIKVQTRNLWINGSNFKSEYTSSDNLFHAFSDSLGTVNITNESDAMASIPNYAFYTTEGNKTYLYSISGYYNRVGDYAFTNNQNLKSANFELLETIGDYAFANCSGLEYVEISKDEETESVTIGDYAFQGNSLKMITIHRGKIATGVRGDETCNKISVSPTAFEGQKPWLLMDMSDQVNVECTSFTKVITNTEAKANEYRNRATNAPKYVTSIQRMECDPADVDMNGSTTGADAQAVYNSMK